MRLCTQTRLIKECALTDPTEAGLQAIADGIRTIAELEKGEQVWLYFYDGDTGNCIGTCFSQMPE